MINVKGDYTSLSWACLFCVLSTLCGCTTTAPESNRRVESSPEELRSNGQILRDKESLKDSLFTALSHDSTPLKSWENSEGWIAFFGGDLAKALKNFEREDQSDSIKIGLSRTHLELSETYASLDQILTQLTQRWLTLERARPRATLHQHWYDWISYVHQPTASLEETLKASPEMAPWLALVSAPTEEHAPPKSSRSYRKWLKFNRALALGDLKSASMMYKTLKLRSPAIRIKGEGDIPSLPIYDLRVYQSLQRYHAFKAIESLKTLTGWATLLRARAQLLAGSLDEGINTLKALHTQPPTTLATSSQLLLSASGTLFDLKVEVAARLVSAFAQKKERAQAQRILKDLSAISYAPAPTSPGTQKVKTSSAAKSSVFNVWYHWALSAVDPSRESKSAIALIEHRREIAHATFQVMEASGGAHHQEVGALGVIERWLDVLCYRLAESLIRKDQWVLAMNALQVSEDLSAAMKLGGRNRASRLILTGFNQLQMKRYRVASKYFNRLRDHFPEIAPIVEMTSDILSGKALRNSGKVNAGQ